MSDDATSPTPNIVQADPWGSLAALTPARLALGRTGNALPTRRILDLAMAHAQARDAVHAPFDTAALAAELRRLGHDCVAVESAAASRDIYLRRPDLGRRLSAGGRDALGRLEGQPPEVSIVVGDGLSAAAVHLNAGAVLQDLVPALRSRGHGVGPIVLARQARVALGDEIGERLGSKLVVVLIGERPGLSAADSLGAYLTFAPRVGRTDAERNCVSNMRPDGLAAPRAAAKIAWLIERALALSLTGVGLKDESEGVLASAAKASIDRA